MRILRSPQYRQMPWKNGGGVTVEIAVSPPDASVADFDWRVSMARVETPGSFSRFDGVDRTLSVIEGESIVLSIEGREVRLERNSEPCSFAGDVPVEAALPAGPIADLNVMTRRERFSHAVERFAGAAETTVDRRGETTLVVLRGSGAEVVTEDGGQRMAEGDSLVLEGDDPSEILIRPDGEAEIFAAHFTRL
ncbi:hypothetical protein SAMN05216548_101118 [Faunimonas pinastri]|uniref:HutD family protein n=1 Tax=Faunimonas pinastri TaxID=1855383 RepID=A0A1H8ZD72_9HYPH|nr:HutD family protein [Faunimonas pinastri]SEP62325.1 hypothetical protein SAMN05216548_101118 [Faunimonas pinastri]